MRRSFLLAHLTRLLMPMLALASIFFLFRGHDLPGGGFVGGLLLATAFLLEGLSEGAVAARRALRVKPELLIVSGLLTALMAGASGLALKGIFLKALWWQAPSWLGGLKVGSPFFFDLGVYFVVSGTILMIYFSIKEG